MKHLKIFENKQDWNEQSLKHHVDDNRFLHKNLEDYIFWKLNLIPDENVVDVDYFYFGEHLFKIFYEDGDGEDCEHNVQPHDLDEMFEFLNTVEMRADANKYNL